MRSYQAHPGFEGENFPVAAADDKYPISGNHSNALRNTARSTGLALSDEH